MGARVVVGFLRSSTGSRLVTPLLGDEWPEPELDGDICCGTNLPRTAGAMNVLDGRVGEGLGPLLPLTGGVLGLRGGVLGRLMGPELGPERGANRSRAALISGGIGTWCTAVTACQSAGCIILYSKTPAGGRQHPGHPVLDEVPVELGGLALAHLQ